MSLSKISIGCAKIIEMGWLAAIIIAPLFFDPYTSTVTQTDKTILLRGIVIVMAAAWLILSMERRVKPASLVAILRAPLALAIVLFLVTEIISTLTSIAPRFSLLGAYHRPDGLGDSIACVVIFGIIVQNLRTRAQLHRLMFAFILPSLPVALYAIVQRFGWDPLSWSGEDFGGRVGSTLGNPIFMAGYLIMAVNVSIAQFFWSCYSLWVDKKKDLRAATILAIALYGAIAIIQALAIFYSESRGPWLGELVGLFFFFFLLAILFDQDWIKRVILLLGVVGIILLALLNALNFPLGVLRDLPGVGRLGRLTDSTANFRIQTWDNVARLVAPHSALEFPDGASDTLNLLRPILGYGADTLSLIYPQLAAPDPLTQSRATDHSHNETWDVLATSGIAGLIAYQILFLAVFLQALGYLDLLPTRRARNLFVGMWIGMPLIGGGAAIALGHIQYVGLMIPAGNVASLAIYLLWTTRQSKNRIVSQIGFRADQILMAGLLASLAAHFVEVQFGINLVATRTMFWVIAALVWVISLGPGGEAKSLAAERSGEISSAGLGKAVAYAFMIALALSTIIFGFVVSGQKDVRIVLWSALTFNPISQSNSIAILVIVLATLTIGAALAVVELHCEAEVKKTQAARQFAWVAGTATFWVLLFAFTHSALVSALPALPNSSMNSHDALALGDQLVWLINGYLIDLFALIALGAIAMMWEPGVPIWFGNPRTRWALAPIAVAALFWANLLNFNLTRADIYYRLAQAMDTRSDRDASSALYQHAATLSPFNDSYYMALARSFSEKANSPLVSSDPRFNEHTTLQDVLEWDGSLVLSRNDLLYATLLTLLRARDLNPLYVNHTLNLARFNIPAAPIDSPSKERLASIAEKYFAQAVRLDPNNARVWNEWADFELTNRNDANAALAKLNESVARDPQFVETYLALGEVYRLKQNYDSATSILRRAFTVDRTRADVASKLAFVYYQQGKHAESIAAYQTFIELAPLSANLWEAHKNLALLYSLENNAPRAVSEAQIAAQLAPNEYREQVNQLVARLQAQFTAR